MKVRRMLIVFLVFLSLVSILNFTNSAIESSSPSNVTLAVFQVLRDTFDGSTTVFEGLSRSELETLSGVVLEISSYGRVDFNENLDMIAMAGSDWIVDFDSDLNISSNLIVVDESNLPGITKSANLTIRGLTYTDPVIKHNGVDCADCTLISYSGGVLVFSVNSFSGVYYARENPSLPVCGNGICESGETSSSCPADCGTPSSGGGGGGGGGGGATTTTPTEQPSGPVEGYDFQIEPDFLIIKMAKGTYYQKLIKVTNNGTENITISPTVVGVSDFIFPELDVFAIDPGQSIYLRLDIYISNKRPSDVYVGKIIFQSHYVTKTAEVILDVKERNALFDIRTEVLKKYVNPGGRVRANISLVNMGDLRNFDVNLEYKIIDFDKKEYSVKKEDFAINRTYQNVFFLDVPEDIDVGNYLFYSKVSYGNVSASSYDTFVVEKVSYLAWIILVISIIILMFLVVRWYRKKRFDLYKKFFGDKDKEVKKRNLSDEVFLRVPKLP